MKYDDASWHYGGKFPKDLPDTAAGTHSGMFLAWALVSGLGNQESLSKAPEIMEQLQLRHVTPGAILMELCDEKFLDLYLNREGNAFAAEYFDLEKGAYLADYEEVLAEGLPSLYHVADSWENWEKLKPVIDRRYVAWKTRR